MGGPRLSSWEKARRREAAESRRRSRRRQLSHNKKKREHERLASKARTARDRLAVKQRNAQEAARLKKDGIYNDRLARNAMEEITNLHLEGIHPYFFLNAESASSLASINIYEQFEPKDEPVFNKKKTPAKPKSIKFKMPAFKKVKGEIKNIEIKLILTDKERNFSVKEYLKKVKRSGFFLFWIINKEKDRYQSFILKGHEKYRILKNDLSSLKKSLNVLKKEAEDNHAASEAKKIADHNALIKQFKSDEDIRKKQFDKDLVRFKKDEKAREEKHNSSIASKDKSRSDWLLKLKQSDKKTVLESFEFMFPLNFVSEMSRERLKNDKALDDIRCGYIFSKNEVQMLIRLPESFQFLPKEWIRLTPSGKSTTTYVISDTERRRVLRGFLASLGLAYARTIYESVQVSNVHIEVSVLGDDPMTGAEKDIILLLMDTDYDTYKSMNLNKVEPDKAVKNFNKTKFKPPRVEDREVYFDSEVDSTIDTSKIVWCDREDSSLDMDELAIDAIQTTMDMFVDKKMSKYERKIKRS
jgi:hypothetical protein